MHRDTIFIIEDDSEARDSLGVLVQSMGLAQRGFCSAEQFLSEYDASWEGCALIDVFLPGISGLELLGRLAEENTRLAVVMISGQGTIPLAVEALHQGATDFLTKPYLSDELQQAIRHALTIARAQRREREEAEELQRRFKSLTLRERKVLKDILADKPNRSIAKYLSVSLRTVARLRASIYEKLGVISAMDLARKIARYGLVTEQCDLHMRADQSSSDSA